jgi:hypothetical protein
VLRLDEESLILGKVWRKGLTRWSIGFVKLREKYMCVPFSNNTLVLHDNFVWCSFPPDC